MPAPPSSTQSWWCIGLVLGTLAAGACDAPAKRPPPGSDAPPPAEAIRPRAQAGRVPARARIADYDLAARLDTDAHRVEGHARITWRNRTHHPVSRMPLHLYMNAFRAEDTAWMREGRGTHRGQGQGTEQPWGYCDVTRVTRSRPDGSTTELPFAEGWDGTDDPSLMTVELREVVPPGGEVVLDIDFVTQLPRVFARTGFAGDFHMVAQWFPKVAVLEPDGRWDAHVFGFHSEFYADFGDYRGTLDVPAGWVVGATGVETQRTTEGDRQRVEYRASMVHDFAWATAPDLVETRHWHDGIFVRQLLAPELAEDAMTHARVQFAALDSMQARFGPYPWSTITIVHPPPEAAGAQGMEYPTLYTTSPILGLPPGLASLGYEERITGVFTTIHEFGHQYFQGLLASNEHAQPWVDEGMNTFANTLVLDDTWGRNAAMVRVAGHALTIDDLLRIDQHRAGALDPVDQPADAFEPLIGSYGSVVYRHTTVVMRTLRTLVGAEAFDDALHRYADTWRFGHPTGADLEATLVEALGEHPPVAASVAAGDDPPIRLDLRRYLDQGLRRPATVDFRVVRATNARRVGTAGWHRDETGALVGGDPPDTTPVARLPDDAIEGVAVIARSGEMTVPVVVEARFADGTHDRRLWDAERRFTVLRWPGRRLVSVAVDPDGDLLVEYRRNDNHRHAVDGEAPPGLPEALGELGQAASLAVMTGLMP